MAVSSMLQSMGQLDDDAPVEARTIADRPIAIIPMLTLSSVPAHEAAPFCKDFLASFPDGRVGFHLQAQAIELERLCAGLTESGATFHYAEGKWTIKEVIGHLAQY